jgi:hypothetical protein
VTADRQEGRVLPAHAIIVDEELDTEASSIFRFPALQNIEDCVPAVLASGPMTNDKTRLSLHWLDASFLPGEAETMIFPGLRWERDGDLDLIVNEELIHRLFPRLSLFEMLLIDFSLGSRAT